MDFGTRLVIGMKGFGNSFAMLRQKSLDKMRGNVAAFSPNYFSGGRVEDSSQRNPNLWLRVRILHRARSATGWHHTLGQSLLIVFVSSLGNLILATAITYATDPDREAASRRLVVRLTRDRRYYSMLTIGRIGQTRANIQAL